MRSKARTVEAYIAELAPERQSTMLAIRELILTNLQKGFVESMTWGMPTYEVPLRIYPNTYNKKPLMFLAFAAQKNYYSLYLMQIYQDDESYQRLEAAFQRINKKVDIGKSCLRFKSIGDIPLEEIGDMIANTSVDAYITLYEKQYKHKEETK